MLIKTEVIFITKAIGKKIIFNRCHFLRYYEPEAHKNRPLFLSF